MKSINIYRRDIPSPCKIRINMWTYSQIRKKYTNVNFYERVGGIRIESEDDTLLDKPEKDIMQMFNDLVEKQND